MKYSIFSYIDIQLFSLKGQFAQYEKIIKKKKKEKGVHERQKKRPGRRSKKGRKKKRNKRGRRFFIFSFSASD